MSMVMRVRVIWRANVFHLIDATAFWATFDGTIARHLRVKRSVSLEES